MARPLLEHWEPAPNTSYGIHDLPLELANAHAGQQEIVYAFSERTTKRRASEPAPETLFQYTGIGGLFGICQSEQIWLHESSFMNDPLEGTWVHHRALSGLNHMDEGTLKKDQRELVERIVAPPVPLWLADGMPQNAVFAALERILSRGYLACFSENGDLLSQWRAYGASGAGVAVGFDLRDMTEAKFDLGFMTIRPSLMKVLYCQDTLDAELQWLYEQQNSWGAAFYHLKNTNPHVEGYLRSFAIDGMARALKSIRWEFKAPGYSEEAEWRLVLTPPASFRDMKFRQSRDAIVPYAAIPIPKRNAHLAIREIILGPTCDIRIADSLRDMLEARAQLKLSRSSLALR